MAASCAKATVHHLHRLHTSLSTWHPLTASPAPSPQKPALIKTRELLNRKSKERAQRQAALEERTRKRAACEERLESLRGELADSRAALEQAEAELAAAEGAAGDINLTPELRAEFQALKLQAAVETVDLARQLRSLEAALADRAARLATESKTLVTMQAQLERLRADADEARLCLRLRAPQRGVVAPWACLHRARVERARRTAASSRRAV